MNLGRFRLCFSILLVALLLAGCGSKAVNPEPVTVAPTTEAKEGDTGATVALTPTNAAASATSAPATKTKVKCVISLQGENVKDIKTNGDYLYSFICVDEKGNEILIQCHKVWLDDNGRIIFEEGGWICNISPLGGMSSFAMAADSDSEDAELHWLMEDNLEEENVTSEQDIIWGAGYIIKANSEKKPSYPVGYSKRGKRSEYLKIEAESGTMWLDSLVVTYTPGTENAAVAVTINDREATGSPQYKNKYVCRISLKDGQASDIVKDGDSIRSFVVKDAEGNPIKISCNNVSVDSDQNLVLHPNGSIYTLTKLNGIVAFSCNDAIGDSCVLFAGGYCRKKEVNSSDEVYYCLGRSKGANQFYHPEKLIGGPSYLSFWFDSDPDNIQEDVIVGELVITYDGVAREEQFQSVSLKETMYGYYVEGDYYDPEREVWDLTEENITFYLDIVPNSLTPEEIDGWSIAGTSNFKVGNLYDASGKTKDKNTETLKCGDQIGVYLDEVEYLVDLPVYPRYAGNDLHDAMPYLTWNSKGELNVLVVPFYYEDQESQANTTNLNYIKQSLGRVIEMDGSITTYSPETSGVFSLSEYFDIASYGNVKINSFVTDWKGLQGIFNGDMESNVISESNLDEIGIWVVENYANQLSILDADKNGIFDAVILVCAPPSGNVVSYRPFSNNGAYKAAFSQGTERISQDGTPVINAYSFINVRMVFERGEISKKQMENGALIHEFSHGFGLIDYYDVSYSGMDAVGGYDMESNNVGDWNVYSKYAVGWVEPIVVTPAEIEEKGLVEVTISSFSDTGSFLVIPTVNTEVRDGQLMTPFEEYLAIELFTPTGVERYDASKIGLGSVTGVRIYHIDAKRRLFNRTDNVHNTQYSLGEELRTNGYNKNGLYQVEVIQKGGTNLFGNPKKYRSITASDFFYAGDSFSMKKHADFFLNGLMDDRSEFPYTITVKSIKDGKATIVISK